MQTSEDVIKRIREANTNLAAANMSLLDENKQYGHKITNLRTIVKNLTGELENLREEIGELHHERIELEERVRNMEYVTE